MNDIKDNPSIVGMVPQSWYFDLIYSKKFVPYTNGWFYEPSMGWLFTQPSIFPYFFQSTSNGWLYFQAENDIPGFYNYSTKKWTMLDAGQIEQGR